MDLNLIFREISKNLLSEFEQSGEYGHTVTQGSYREDQLAEFLRDGRLPHKYKVLKGEIVSSKTGTAEHFDLIIFDSSRAPIWKQSQSISVVPIEGVSGIIEVKSSLSKAELRDALEKIKKLREMVPISHAQITAPGTTNAYPRPSPFGLVFGYQLSNNSLESLAQNLTEYEKDLEIYYWPNCVAVLNEGLLYHLCKGYGEGLKVEEFKDAEGVWPVHFGDETLFQFFNAVFYLLNTIHIGEFDPVPYTMLPVKIGDHYVNEHTVAHDTETGELLVLNEKGINEIFNYCREAGQTAFSKILRRMTGREPTEALESIRDDAFFLYDPDKLPAQHETPEFKAGGENALIGVGVKTLSPYFIIKIDGEHYVLPQAYIVKEWLEPRRRRG